MINTIPEGMIDDQDEIECWKQDRRNLPTYKLTNRDDKEDIKEIFLKAAELVCSLTAFEQYRNNLKDFDVNKPMITRIAIMGDLIEVQVSLYYDKPEELVWGITMFDDGLENLFNKVKNSLTKLFPNSENIVRAEIASPYSHIEVYLNQYVSKCADDYNELIFDTDAFYQLPTDVAKVVFAQGKEILRELTSDQDEFDHTTTIQVQAIGFSTTTSYEFDEFGIGENGFGNIPDSEADVLKNKLQDYLISIVGKEYEGIDWDKATGLGISANGFFVSSDPDEDDEDF